MSKAHFSAILLGSKTLLTLKQQFDVRRRNECETLCIILLEPTLGIPQKIPECRFLKKYQNNLKGNENKENNDDMPDFELIPR
jgi:hypothetical protein